jgi:hypothetical protein
VANPDHDAASTMPFSTGEGFDVTFGHVQKQLQAPAERTAAIEDVPC